VLLNLSICLAQTGVKTLIVGADLNSPDIGKRFSIDEGEGLTDILLGASPWEETVKTVTDMVIGGMTLDMAMSTPGLDRLNIITRGTRPNKTAELIGTKNFSEFLGAVRDAYDIIIIDSPAVLSSADAATLAAQADGLIVVYNPAQVPERAIKRTCAQLGRMKCNIIGIVLNCVRPALIPDVLREKYSETEADSKAEQPSVKNRGIAKVLIPVTAIIIIAALIWWKRDVFFTERPEIKVKEIVKPSKKPAEVKPRKPDRPEQKPYRAETPDTKVPVEMPVEKSVIPEEVNQKQPEVVHEHPAPDEMETGMIYHEGRFPYSVYLGSFNTTEQVRSAIDYYQKTGIPSFWVKVNLGEKGIWYRVYSGEFADKEGAEAFINEKAIKDGEIKKTAYAVYVGSFTDRERLEKEMAILSEKGYSPYVISDENYDNLFAGAFVTKTGADELSTELNTLGIANKVVLR
jgi:cell division septation protein DedD